MPIFNIQIAQVYRTERVIVIQVEADDLQSAIEQQATDEAPDFDDPRWRTGWDLQNEEVTEDGR